MTYVMTTSFVKQHICDLSIGQLRSVPPRLVGRCRLVVLGLLQRPELLLEPSWVPSHGMREYRARCHLANSISDELRVAISGNLDMALRADPSAAGGSVTYKLYDPEFNTNGKHQRMIYRKMNQQLGTEACGSISSSTFKQILKDYMLERDGRLSFARHDHNVCIHCQGLEIDLHALELELQTMPPSCDPETRRVREAQLASAQEELNEHVACDRRVRAHLGRLIDILKVKENKIRSCDQPRYIDPEWNSLPSGAGLLTNSDDMSAINVTHFVQESSSELTKFAY